MRCIFLSFSLAAVMIIKLSSALEGDVSSIGLTQDTTGRSASGFQGGDSYASGNLFSSTGNIASEFFQHLGSNSGIANNDAVSGVAIGVTTLEKSILDRDPITEAILKIKNNDKSAPMQPRSFLLRRRQGHATLQRRSQTDEEQENERQDEGNEDENKTEDKQIGN